SPRRSGANNNLGNVYAGLGQYEKAAEMLRQSHQMSPETGADYGNLANVFLALQRYDQAENLVQEARARKVEDDILEMAAYALAFLKGDTQGKAERLAWLSSK